jgi:acyl CoA:acetate/3-ketoacid CoA transferase beta subunit
MSEAVASPAAETQVRRADVCAVAIAEAYRGNGEIMASPMGTLPSIGARLARLTFEPDLLLSDGEAFLLGSVPALGAPLGDAVVEGWIPYRQVFDVVASGRRHVMMGASQIDPTGNTNISCIGDQSHPKSQLLGVRGAPGNTVNHRTSYWIPKHSARVFVPAVDMVSGVGYARAAAAGAAAARFHGLGRVITDLAVLDFGDAPSADARMRLVSVHPGVTLAQVVEATGFELDGAGGDVPTTREPSEEELRLIGQLDPKGLRYREVAA